MTPPLNEEQETLIKKLYYDDKVVFGRDKLWRYITENHKDSNISRRQTLEWLKKQENYQLNVRPPTRKSTKPIQSIKEGYISIDLIDYSNSPLRGFRYILNSLDVFTKKASAIALKNKRPITIRNNMDKLLEAYNKVSVVQTDNGVEFDIDDYFEENNIKHLRSQPYTPQSNGAIERFNSTLKHMLNQIKPYDWVRNLDICIENYNKTYHRTIGTSPDKMNDEETKQKAVEKIVNKRNRNPAHTRLKDYKVGDKCRVVLIKGAFDKKSINTYTKEIYEVIKVIKSRKPYILDSYKLQDSDGDAIAGTYNSSQLQLIED
jgi:transposase InsO family protein